jgi:alcohol dehydrogenase (cytochrome c)
MKPSKMMLLAGLLPFALAQAADVTSAMLEKADKDTKNVLSFGMGSQGQRFSPLTQVNTRTVAQLVPARYLG